MFSSAYETSILARQRLTPIIDELTYARTDGALRHDLLPQFPFLGIVVGKNAVNDRIGVFNHPLLLNDGTIALDLRPFTNTLSVSNDGSIKINDNTPAMMQVRMGLYQKLWLDDTFRNQLYTNVGNLPIKTFVNWVGDAIVRKLGIDPQTQLQVRTLVGWYYRCLFLQEEEVQLDDQSVYRYASRLTRVSFQSIDDIAALIEQYGYLADLDALVRALADLPNRRIQGLTTGVIYTILNNTWYGTASSRELVAAALEHPPTFLAILYSALTERRYRKAGLTTAAEQAESRDASIDETVRGLGGLVEQIKE